MKEIDESGNVAHYAPLCHFANILSDQKIKLSFVKNLSDPRESSLGWVETVGIGESITGWKQAKRIKNDVGSQLKIFCTADQQRYLMVQIKLKHPSTVVQECGLNMQTIQKVFV